MIKELFARPISLHEALTYGLRDKEKFERQLVQSTVLDINRQLIKSAAEGITSEGVKILVVNEFSNAAIRKVLSMYSSKGWEVKFVPETFGSWAYFHFTGTKK